MKPFLWPLVLFVIVSGCKDPFMPNIPDSQANVLVVEGYINVGSNAVTTISLARTTAVAKKASIDYEEGALVSIQTESDDEYFLTHTKNGIYVSNPLNLSLDRRYRLAIRTSDGRSYTSSYSTPIKTPPMDSVTWQWTPRGIGINVSTHDDTRNTIYYQWDFEEAWSVPSEFESFYIYVDGRIKNRPVEERIAMRQCWKYDVPPDLITTSTVAFNDDAVLSKQLQWIPIGGERLVDKYSILVKQHALSKKAYEYLSIMAKNSNNLGSFTDPQPSQLFSNITSVIGNEQVVGWLEAYSTEQHRLFISASQLPYWGFSLGCKETQIPDDPAVLAEVFNDQLWFVTKATVNPNLIWGAPAHCVDCRLRGGTSPRPDFWQ